VTHLAAAVEKVGTWQTPVRLNDTTRTYFEKLASISKPAAAARYRSVLNPNADTPAAVRYFAEFEPMHYSVLRTSVVPTMLAAGVAPNVIPSAAEAAIDIRALPDEDVPAFLREMGRVINDPTVAIVPLPIALPAAPLRPLSQSCIVRSSAPPQPSIRARRPCRACSLRVPICRTSAQRGCSPTVSVPP
jgi:acetylornithine deacetylase/succinyl-diaminopimelate desuccinylase-like protein